MKAHPLIISFAIAVLCLAFVGLALYGTHEMNIARSATAMREATDLRTIALLQRAADEAR